jgi:localization factor PodJL
VGAAAALGLLAWIGVNLQLTSLPGSAKALFERGEAFYSGRGVPQNFQQAADLYAKAAAAGYAPAQNALGFLYEYGIGVSKNLVRAKEYYKLAASKGNPDAKAGLVRLEAEQ